ncbi:oxidoreductase [Tenacibaculum sp. FZY0031]|uniref:oxidoreductase n=1 Tax=Tenacibaculum sp. FZY0031 TaxID=3116648 RepID=UPI002EB5437B|nr:oxidoreductase [Tenacibaculum sp. FZY0031]
MKKVILITGASAGMGKDGALRLIKEGHIVYGGARRINKMQDIIDAGGHSIELDVTNIDSIKNAVNTIIRDQGRIDVLWNNAGYSVTGAVEDVSYEDAKKQFEVNLFGLSEVTKAVLPFMREQKSGTIINTSSVGGKIFSPLGAWYHATKHALEGWSDSLRIELKPFNINVAIIEPGGISTEFGNVLYQPLIDRSKGGAYEEISKKVADSYKANYADPKRLAPTSVVSDVAVRIINSKRPKTRYVVGYMSKTTIFMRWLLTDRMFEKIIVKFF